MGCLNSNEGFAHWFGNIHLSGPCNRSCYFCIGQHMMALDSINSLTVWPMPGMRDFTDLCLARFVREVNVTGTNTDPLLYRHTEKLRSTLADAIPGLVLGLRTNGVLLARESNLARYYDKGSVTICSTNPQVYAAMMGSGRPPSLDTVLRATEHWTSLKVNVVLGPENTTGTEPDVWNTISDLQGAGVKVVNLREPYGQPHVGDPLAPYMNATREVHGMPTYDIDGCAVTYWDVHYVEVESVNLYATGRVSETYPITKGHASTGQVLEQSNFTHGRHMRQWRG